MKQLSIALLTLILLVLLTPSLKAQVNKQDSLALVDLYNSTNGAKWDVNTNWLTTAPVSTWYGVIVDSNGRVTSLVLLNDLNHYFYPYESGINLNGSLPSSIGDLTELRTLNLTNIKYNYIGGVGAFQVISANGLTGAIPASIGNLKKLTNLDLSYNKLTGSVPSSIRNLTNLSSLNLSYNNTLTGDIFNTICNIQTLEILNLQYNAFGGGIDSIGKLNKINALYLNNNQLSGLIPSSIGNISSTTALDLSYNHFLGAIPFSVTNLKNAMSRGIFGWQGNKFTFTGTEALGLMIDTGQKSGILEGPMMYSYAPQDTIIPIKRTGNQLSVSVGGRLANDTFKWYKDDSLIATVAGDSTYTVSSIGRYWMVASNVLANQLKLYSDTINITALPIQSISLQAKTINGNTLLQWQTINEINTQSFVVQRSMEGKSFADCGGINAAGSGSNSYSFQDSDAGSFNSTTVYYRIKALDKDGNYIFSPVISLLLTANRFPSFTIFPNPAKDVLTIKGNNITSVQIIDNAGKMVVVSIAMESTNPQLFIKNLPAGNYMAIIKTKKGEVNAVKFIKE
ncbi:leucine-rich repeat domain-containing protein [Parasediminibacterium sp. JCM 36343]|uniref:leucine-rich repeat domain-containing protein n=1 Tax=Parasediminibacterium sp. JCM 36343 TaxID=3374279 RepID=UPI003978E2C9